VTGSPELRGAKDCGTPRSENRVVQLGGARVRTAIRARDRARRQFKAGSGRLSNRSALTISACDEDQPSDFCTALPDLRQAADTPKPAFLLGTLRSHRSRSLAQRKLSDRDRRGPRREL